MFSLMFVKVDLVLKKRKTDEKKINIPTLHSELGQLERRGWGSRGRLSFKVGEPYRVLDLLLRFGVLSILIRGRACDITLA